MAWLGLYLQVDATMIIGVLFFLTLTSFLGAASYQSVEGKLTPIVMTIGAVFPFSVSAISVLLASRNAATNLHPKKVASANERRRL
jgi:hypothetical protein